MSNLLVKFAKFILKNDYEVVKKSEIVKQEEQVEETKPLDNNEENLGEEVKITKVEDTGIFDDITVDSINKLIKKYKYLDYIGLIKDGYHTFNELYDHRAKLFAVIVNNGNIKKSFKSKLHYDGTMYDGMFIVGINTPEGCFTYHCKLEYWDLFRCAEVERAPEWDGHTSDDITRLFSLGKKKK